MGSPTAVATPKNGSSMSPNNPLRSHLLALSGISDFRKLIFTLCLPRFHFLPQHTLRWIIRGHPPPSSFPVLVSVIRSNPLGSPVRFAITQNQDPNDASWLLLVTLLMGPRWPRMMITPNRLGFHRLLFLFRFTIPSLPTICLSYPNLPTYNQH
jgi:hypothetical protein